MTLEVHIFGRRNDERKANKRAGVRACARVDCAATGKKRERKKIEDEDGWRATEGTVLRSTQTSKGGTRDLYFRRHVCLARTSIKYCKGEDSR